MSLTISTNDMSFAVYGQGHDYTLAGSGEGTGPNFFSHPYVPLNSINYQQQYRLFLPDEDGNITDVCRTDVSHCTFTPALGTAFTTVGTQTITLSYHREYAGDNSTIVVDKTVTQEIEVVDHGDITVAGGSTYTRDIYEDGYCFWRPWSVSAYNYNYYAPGNNSITKCSSIPWGATRLGNSSSMPFLNSSNLVDISELAYADVSSVTKLNYFLRAVSLTDISALAEWDVSSVTSFNYAFYNCTALTDMSPLANWNVSKGRYFEHMFYKTGEAEDFSPLASWNVKARSIKGMFTDCYKLKSIEFLASWDVSAVTTLESVFHACFALESLEGLENWDVSNVTSMKYLFASCEKIPSTTPLANWDTSKVTDMTGTFRICRLLTDLTGLANWDTSEVTNLTETFLTCRSLLNVDGLDNWDVSGVKTFTSCFNGAKWLSDLSALANWDVSTGNTFTGMFAGAWALTSLSDLANWDMSSATSISAMFNLGNNGKVYSLPYSEEYVGGVASVYYKYYTDEVVAYDIISPYTTYTRDASGVSGWTINISNPNAFDSDWENIPSWN